ncbi:MAG: hypothetical protein KDE19_03335, partial [Caldilineaceae bacterium]|nr:hypothetical protein [Caldilineaceae bacterium]
GCGGDADRQEPTVAVTVAAGGMVLPTPVNVQPTATAQTATDVPATATDAMRGFQPGQTVQATVPLLLYADADAGTAVMNRYPTAARFTVLEPSGDYRAYPVQRDAVSWYRLRATDGLVGWAMAAEVTLAE